ncbi:MAG TPA: protein translocase subunit SecD [Armatimonadota bacterium]|jgi:protein-export membrane protein SecD
MQGRFKLWIASIVGLLLLGFLIGFGPIRPAPKGFTVQNQFRYSLPQPVGQEKDLESANGQIGAELRAKVSDFKSAKFITPTLLEVSTFATTEQMATTDQQQILQALQPKYAGIKQEAAPEPVERPITQWGDWLAIYPPKPQIRLGLDLQGGAQVVLLARPETTLNFISPEDKPIVAITAPEQPAAVAGEKPAAPVAPAASAAKLPTSEDLSKRILASLQQVGQPIKSMELETSSTGRQLMVGRDSLLQTVATVQCVSPNRIEVKTRAKVQAEADRDENAVLRYLQDANPGVDVKLGSKRSVFIEKNTADKVRNVVERRLYAMSDIREPVIQTQGDDRVIVELPGVKDPKRVVDILGTTALLEFMLIPEKYEPQKTESDDYSTWTNKYSREDVPWEQVRAESEAPFTGADLKSNAQVTSGQGMELVVSFELLNEKKDDFRKFSGKNVGRYMAIVLDGKAQMAPVIQSEIPGNGIISGKFTPDDAAKLALLLNAGALPVPLEIAENRTVSATLGADSIRQSLLAGLIGLALVIAFMVLAYRVPGVLADIALLLYLVMLLAVLKMANATLTLPGIAAFIMSLGMAVDANILIFERLKEELYSGKTPRAAVVAGFDRAWTAILDANVTTLIGAAVLYFLGTSSVKSFAVTLFLGVIVHLFTAVTVSRWLVTMLAHTRLGQKLSVYGVPKPE